MHNHVHHASVSALTLPLYGPPLRRTALALLLATCFGAAQANPALPQVVNGQATFNQQGNIFSITNTPNTIINWQSFSIHAGEITRFIQENGNSAVLNRITGQDPSKILGALESNGKVFLINPNGIVFGQGARVDVNGLVASSLGISNEDFLAGKRQFTAGSTAGAVSNAGAIRAGSGGQVLLIAPNVENTGIITAPNGEVILAAGRSVQLADPGNPQLRVLVSAPADQALNLGQIIAQGGSIGMAGALVSQRGVLNANSAVVGQNGKIVLKASGQTVLSTGSVTSATGAGQGGEVQVLGDQVGLFGDAKIDASGGTGGGTVLLGGDYQGKNAAVQNARQVVLGKDASVNADAVNSGKGGKVIAWGDESAQVHGSISARGGAQGGDGGFVETSGHYLAVDGIRVDTRARSGHGKTGDWLLDPYDIDVIYGTGGSLDAVDSFSEGTPSVSTSIGADTIADADANVILQATHRINFSNPISMRKSGVGLTAIAGETINVYAPITTLGGAVKLSANDASAGVGSAPGSLIQLNAAITTGNGGVILSGASVQGAGAVNVGTGNLNIVSNYAGGKIALSGTGVQLKGSGVANQVVSLQADNVSLGGGIDFGGTAGSAHVAITPPNALLKLDLGALATISAASLTIGDGANTGGMQISGSLVTTGDLHLNSGSPITTTGAVSVGGTFVLDAGAWMQNAASLPTFSAGKFTIAPTASFLRVIGGTGDAGTPYGIADIYGLQGIGSLVLGNSYRLAGNIDASGTLNWNGGKGFVPIAGGGAAYSGVFDGGGFAISSLTIDGSALSDSPAGLFGTLQGGTLRNLSLNGGSVSGIANVGALVGNVISGTIENVSSSAAVSGRSNVGGLVGRNGGSISNAYATGTVGALANSGSQVTQANLGGLIGWNAAGGNVSNVYSTGAVAGNDFTANTVGGLVGRGDANVVHGYWNVDTAGIALDQGGATGLNNAQMQQQGSFGGFDFSSVWRIYDGNTMPMLKAFLKPLRVDITDNASGKVYDGNVASFLGTLAYAGLLDGDTGVNGSLSYGNNARNVGNYGLTGLWSTKYDIALNGTTTFDITARVLNVTLSGVNKTYDGTTGALVNFGDDRITGDALTVAGSAVFGDKNVGVAKTVNVTNVALGGADAGNYVLGANAGSTTADITARTLNVSFGGVNKTYDGTTGTVVTIGDDRIGGDTLTVVANAAFGDKNAGTGKAVNVTNVALGGLDAGNYVLNANSGSTTADIAARTLNVTLSGVNKTYDGTTDAVVTIGDDRIGGDMLTVAANAAFGDKNVGTGKVVNVTQVGLSGADAGNYVINAHTDNVTSDITARLLNYGVLGAQSRVYDGTKYAALNGYFEGLVPGDQVSMAGLLGNFRDKNVGNGKIVDYQVATGHLTGQDAGNYVLNGGAGSTTADITARTLNVSFGGVNKTYDGTTGALVNFGDDRITGDALTVAGSAAFGNKNAGVSKSVNVTNVALGGADAGNYVLNANSGSTTADIAARTLNVTLSGVNKTYDGTTDAVVTIGDDRIGGDMLTVAANAAFGDKNVGTGKVVNVTQVGLSGADAGNYVINAHTANVTSDITARLLNYGVLGAQSRVYDGTKYAALNGYFEGLAPGDQVSMAGLLGNFRDKNVGNGKIVDYQVATGHLTGQDAGNYVLNGGAGSTTADITARTLNVSFGGVNKTYDGTTGALVNFGDDRITGDALTVAGSAAFGDKNAGTGKTVNVSNVVLNGGDAGNYVLGANTGSTTADIGARTLNVTLNGVNKTYDGMTGALVNFGDDRITGDALTVAGSAAFGDKNAGIGKSVNVTNLGLNGVDAGNYVLGANTGSTTADITARTLKVTLNGVNKTYDGTTGALVNFSDDRITGDALTVAGNAAFGDKNAGVGKSVNVTNVVLGGGDAGNYVLGANTGSTTADIGARTLNVTLNGVNKTYDGTTGALVNFGDDRITGDALTVAGSAAFGNKNAGIGKTVNVTNLGLNGADAGNYVLGANSGSTTADIGARTLNVTLSGVNKTYDGTTGSLVNFGDDRITGDALTVAGNAAFGDKNAGVGKSVNVTNVVLGGGDAGNYVLGANTGSTTADIGARTLNVTLNGVNKTYDGTTGALVNFGDDRIQGDALTVAGSAAFGDKNAGIGKTVNVTNVVLGGGDAGNYVLNANSGTTTADIAARTLNVTLSGVNKTYDGTMGALVNFGDDRITGDALTVAASAAFGDKNAGVAKTVNVTNLGLNGGDAGNYVLNANSGSTTADIGARTLSVTLSGVNKTYDGTTGALVNFSDDRITGDALTVAANAAFGDKNAGTGKSVNVSNVVLGGGDAGNYVLNANSGSTTADITARTLNVTSSGVNKTYDGTTGSLVNFGDDRIQGDALTVAGSAAFGDKNAGIGKTVNVTNVVLGGGDAGNYVLNANSGTTTADIAARTLNVTLSGVNKTYDGTMGALVNFGDDRITGDALTVAGSAAFGDKNAGIGKTVNVTNLGLNGVDAGNYVLGANTGTTTADIGARTLNVTLSGVNKTYDGTTGALVNFGDDRITGDALTVAGNAAFGDKNAGVGKSVNVSNVVLGGGDAGNYVLGASSGSTTADIAARTLNVNLSGVNKTYDGTTGALVNFGDDRITGDALAVAGNAAFGDKNAGTGKTVNVTNVAFGGADAGNYVLGANTGSTTANIAARALNLSGVASNKVYDGTTGASVTLADDRIAGDSLGVRAVANFADKNAGTGKAVSLSGAALTGADAGNYFIVLPTGLLASITPAGLTLAGLNAGNKVYDGTTSAVVSATANGVLGQDVVSVVGGSGNFADRNAGAGKQVTLSGFRLAGADAGNYTLETTGGTTQASIAQKQLSTWVGSGNGLWSDAANWDGGVVPEGANVLAVDFSRSNGVVTYSAAAGSTILKNLNSATGLLLTGGSLTLGASVLDRSVLSGLAGLEISGGNLLLNGSLSADRYAQSGGMLSGNGNLAIANQFSQAAGVINLAGQLAISQASGDLRFASLTANEVRLSALNGAISQDGALVAASVDVQAQNGVVLGNAGNQVGSFTASNRAGGGIVLNNTSAPGTLVLGSLSTGAGNIAIDNTGALSAGNINANGGNVTLAAHSPVSVNGKIEGNDIAINASTDVVLADGARLTAARDVSLTAGRGISVEGNASVASGGNVTASAGDSVRFAGTASFTLPAASGMSLLAKAGSITGASGVRINRQRANVSMMAPNGTVDMPDAIFLPTTTISVPVGVSNTIAAIIKQSDRAADAAPPSLPGSTRADDKKTDSKDVADAKDNSTGYKYDEAPKKTYCN
ncbi:YDG domain-containing protein [Janthinobacterium sp. HLX7-2]|uniref:YDG domain-containing protein n=1 Tax=Janthinobacterium sp. HLX7-2 TaxID=1259331 RepID=UPI003F1EFDBB